MFNPSKIINHTFEIDFGILSKGAIICSSCGYPGLIHVGGKCYNEYYIHKHGKKRYEDAWGKYRILFPKPILSINIIIL